MIFTTEKPDFKQAMGRARTICLTPMEPPITRKEIYSVYRMAKTGCIFFRCTFS